LPVFILWLDGKLFYQDATFFDKSFYSFQNTTNLLSSPSLMEAHSHIIAIGKQKLQFQHIFLFEFDQGNCYYFESC
jgi:hypothetical protein